MGVDELRDQYFRLQAKFSRYFLTGHLTLVSAS
ncbi:hypothetical protein T09_11706 [Trichinella sp. T9]|nr:hypothetical protein T09_11706 [Trichinella sp. T9]